MRRLTFLVGAAVLTLAVSGCTESIKPTGQDGLSESTCYPTWLAPTEAACRALVLKRCGPNGSVVGVYEFTRPRYIDGIGWQRKSVWNYRLRGCGHSGPQSTKPKS